MRQSVTRHISIFYFFLPIHVIDYGDKTKGKRDNLARARINCNHQTGASNLYLYHRASSLRLSPLHPFRVLHILLFLKNKPRNPKLSRGLYLEFRIFCLKSTTSVCYLQIKFMRLPSGTALGYPSSDCSVSPAGLALANQVFPINAPD